jgi:hypothetical protein
MSTDLIEFIEIKNLFIKFINNTNYKFNNCYNNENNLTIEDEIISQLLLIISIVIEKQQSNYDYYNFQLKKQIIKESFKLLKKINPSNNP